MPWPLRVSVRRDAPARSVPGSIRRPVRGQAAPDAVMPGGYSFRSTAGSEVKHLTQLARRSLSSHAYAPFDALTQSRRSVCSAARHLIWRTPRRLPHAKLIISLRRRARGRTGYPSMPGT